jgi:hypothetical protein
VMERSAMVMPRDRGRRMYPWASTRAGTRGRGASGPGKARKAAEGGGGYTIEYSNILPYSKAMHHMGHEMGSGPYPRQAEHSTLMATALISIERPSNRVSNHC